MTKQVVHIAKINCKVSCFFSPLHLVCFRHLSLLFHIFNILDLLLNTGIEYIEQIFMILNNRKTKPIDSKTIKKHDHISGT